MKFRWLGFLISGFAFILSFSTVNAECNWGFISCTHPQGTGSDIVFNSLEYSRSKYFWNTDQCISDSDIGSTTQIPGPSDDCLLWRNETLNGFTNTFTDAECASFGASAIPGYGCACLEPTCVINYVNGDNRIKEPYFASARKCLNGSCASRDPLGYAPETPNYEPVPTYEHSLSGTAAMGEKVRVQVYSHDNAQQQFPGDPNYNNYMAHDTDVKVSWNNSSHTAQGIVTSPDATPVTKTSPSITLPALPSGMQYEVVGAWHHYNSATTAGTPNYVAEYFTPTDNELSVSETTATFNLGNHASCFGNVHRTYFDLEVVQTPIPNFTITKTANPGVTTEMHPGETITYSITATNTGNTILPAFTATDSLSPNLTFVSGDAGVSHAGQSVTVEMGNIAIGASITKSFIVSINTNTPTPSQICNQATATNSGINHSSLNICHSITSLLTDFSLAKSATPVSGSHVQAGETITYTVSTTNTGDTPISSIIGTDTLNSHLTFVTGDSGVSHVNGIVTIQFTNIAPGDTASKNFQVLVNSMPTPPWISNAFSATLNAITKTSNQTTHYIDQTNTPDFTLTKTANPETTITMHAGETITYSITATNTGNTILPAFTATDSLNPNLTFVSGDAGVSHAGQSVTVEMGNIAIGASITKNFIVSINTDTPTPSQICNQATATNSGINKNSQNICHNVAPINSPDFTLEKTATPEGGTTLHPGNTIAYSITATNTGNTILPAFTATDSLNPNLTFVSGDAGVSHAGQSVTVEMGNIAIGASITKNFIVSINTDTPTPSQICNQAAATNSGITHSSENVCHDITEIITIDFSIVKSSNPANNSTVLPGDAITYTLHAFNTGNTTLNNLVLTDVLNQNVQYEGSTSPNVSYNVSTHTVTATFATVPVNTQVSAQFTVSVKETALTGIGICNEATGTANNLTVTSNSVCHYIVDEEVSLTKTANIPAGTPVDPGQILTYTISATNNTAGPLDIIVTDPLDSFLQFIGTSNSNLTYDAGTHTVSIAFDNVAATTTVYASFQAQVLDPGVPNAEVCNEVSLVSANTSGNGGASGGNNTAFYEIKSLFKNLLANAIGDQGEPTAWNPQRICHPINTGSSTVDFTLVKNSVPAPNTTLTPGDTIAYTITATNTGTTTLNPLVITDVLNVNVEFPTQFTTVFYDPTTHTVTKTFPNVAPGASVTAQFYVVIKDTATTGIGICNEATGTANNLTVTSNGVCHYIVDEEVSLTKTSDVPAGTPVDPGQILTYTISATNNTVDPLNILVTDPLDSLLEFVGSTNSNLTYDTTTHTVSVLFNNVAPLETIFASFQAKVLDPGAPNTEVCNEVSLVSTSAGDLNNGVWENITKTIKSIFSPLKNLFKSLTSSVFDIRTLELLTANSLNDNQGGGISAFIPERICHPITQPGGGTLLLEKTSDPTPGSTVSTGDTVLYKVQITNNSGTDITETILDPLGSGLSFLAAGTVSSSDTGATGSISFDTTTSLLSLNINNLGNNEWMIFEFNAEVIAANDGTQVCNQANITDLTGQIYESENICLTVYNGGTGGNTFIEKSVSPTGVIANGDTLTYTIRMTSDETTAFSTILNDTLDSHLIYLGNEIITTANTGITGLITHDGSATGGLVELTVNNLSNGWIAFSFDVLVEGAGTSAQICNQASEIDGNLFSNIVCSSTDGGGPGPGPGQTISTIGICTDLVNGSVTCRKHTPHPSFGEEPYQTWRECAKNSTKEDLKICTHDWAAAVGLLAIGECHPDDIVSNQTIGMWNPYNGYYVWNGGLSDENNECNTSIPDPCTPCNEIEGKIVKTTSTLAVAKEENAHYTTILSLEKTEPTGANIKITGIKVYDLTIPAESGWIYDHAMTGSNDWTWNGTPDYPASNYFEFSGESFDLLDNETFVIDYEMETALTIKADTAQVKNVAFAVIEYQIEQSEGIWSNASTFYVGNPSIEDCQDLTILDIIDASTSTEGTSATVKIVRPFVEVRGGGNVGVQKLDDTTENPFGGLQTGGEFEDTLSTGEILTGEETENITETENLWDIYEGQTSDTAELFGTTWQTTPDNSGVYFAENNVILTTENASDFVGSSKTFVITGTLTIESDFEPTVFGAFIADQIIIDKDVEKMIGVFIADTGQIISPEISYKQLVVSGSLMGDATDLLAKRKFIGEHPETQLQPSIKIDYDIRLIDATPPALELFLSEDWTQSTEE